MCLMAMAWRLHPRLPLILAANRDEFHDREASPMAWWEGEDILAGRDLRAGGTWLGVNRQGRIGLLTNVREPGRNEAGLPSRGGLVPLWLGGASSALDMPSRLQALPTNGYNLLGIDLAEQEAHCWSNRHGHRHHLKSGIYGLSNASLDSPWPKLQRLKRELERVQAQLSPFQAQPSVSRSEHLAATIRASLLQALTDRESAPDDQLPRTGISLEWERWLSSIFIQTPDGRYGTRCSTVIIVERLSPDQLQLHTAEQTWDAKGQAQGLVEHTVTINAR